MPRGHGAYENTGVPVSQSQEQIRDLLIRHGARGVQFTEDFSTGHVAFRCVKEEVREAPNGKSILIPLVVRMAIPMTTDPREWVKLKGDPIRRGKRQRQVMRALYWYLKSQFEAVAFGLRTFEDVFMADLELRDGLTIGDHVRSMLSSDRLALPEKAEIT